MICVAGLDTAANDVMTKATTAPASVGCSDRAGQRWKASPWVPAGGLTAGRLVSTVLVESRTNTFRIAARQRKVDVAPQAIPKNSERSVGLLLELNGTQ